MAGDLVMTRDASTAFVLREDGSLDRFHPATSEMTRLHTSAPGSPYVAIAIAQSSGFLYAIASDAASRKAILRSIDANDGAVRESWTLKTDPRWLSVTAGAETALILGLRPGAPDEDPERWILMSLDLGSGAIEGPLKIGFVPAGMTLGRDTDGSPRLFVATIDRIATYTVWPLRASWFYRSPGDNHAMSAAAEGAAIHVLRDETLVIIDPDRRPREQGRVVLSPDDATTIVPLPGLAKSLAVSPDGGTASVLMNDGEALVTIDTRAVGVIDTRRLDPSQDILAPALFVPEDRAGVTIAFLAPGDGTGPPVSRSLPMASTTPPPAEPVAGAPDVQPAPPETENRVDAGMPPVEERVPMAEGAGAAGPTAAPETFDQLDEASSPGEAPSGPTVDSEPVDGSSPDEPALSPDRDPAPVAPPPPPAPAPTVGTLAGDPMLSGRVSGPVGPDTQVLVYGPNNIIKLYARAGVQEDGSYRLPLPPPGRYRVLVTGGPETHVFSTPEFRTVVITSTDRSLGDVDFEIRGKL